MTTETSDHVDVAEAVQTIRDAHESGEITTEDVMRLVAEGHAIEGEERFRQAIENGATEEEACEMLRGFVDEKVQQFMAKLRRRLDEIDGDE